MAFGREIEMAFKRVKVSPEMVGIVVGWLAVLVLMWNSGQDMSDPRTDMSDLHAELKGEIATLRAEVFGEIAHLNERVARAEGYIDRPRVEDVTVTPE